MWQVGLHTLIKMCTKKLKSLHIVNGAQMSLSPNGVYVMDSMFECELVFTERCCFCCLYLLFSHYSVR